MIHLFTLSSLQQYLYSPFIWLHQIHNNIKAFIIFLYLFSLLYLSIRFLIVINICLFIIFFSLPLRTFSIDAILKNNQILYVILFVSCIVLNKISRFNLVNNNIHLVINCSYKKMIVQNNLLLIDKYYININIHFLVSQPKIRLIAILISSALLHKLLLLTTYNKDILYFYEKCHLIRKSYLSNHILFILLLSSEWIYFSEIQIKNFIIAFQLRGFNLILTFNKISSFKIFFAGFKVLIIIKLEEAKLITQSIYSREIISNKQQLWMIK